MEIKINKLPDPSDGTFYKKRGKWHMNDQLGIWDSPDELAEKTGVKTFERKYIYASVKEYGCECGCTVYQVEKITVKGNDEIDTWLFESFRRDEVVKFVDDYSKKHKIPAILFHDWS